MKINVRLFATLRQYAPTLGIGEAMPLEFPANSTLADLIAHLKVPEDEVHRVFINYVVVRHDYILQDGDRVSLFPMIAGG